MKTQYPLAPLGGIDSIINWIKEIVRLRETEDVPDFTNLPNLYMRGRKVDKIPTGNSDVATTDVQGDFNFAVNASHMYILVDKSGNLRWARIALDTTW